MALVNGLYNQSDITEIVESINTILDNAEGLNFEFSTDYYNKKSIVESKLDYLIKKYPNGFNTFSYEDWANFIVHNKIDEKLFDISDKVTLSTDTGIHSQKSDLLNRVELIYNDMEKNKKNSLIMLDGHGRTFFLFVKNG